MTPKRRNPKDYPLVKAGVPVGELPVTHISYFVPLTKQERMARVRARRREDTAIETAIDDYVKDHAEGWAQYVPPSFDDPPGAA